MADRLIESPPPERAGILPEAVPAVEAPPHTRGRAGPWLRAAAGYAFAVTLSLLLLAGIWRLWRADFRVPFGYQSDCLLHLALIKGVIEDGWYTHVSRLGAPSGLDMYDFPMADGLHFGLIKLLTLFTHDPALLFNVYTMLTFPLVALSALFVLRRLNVSYGPALVASLLYTFLPYHLLRALYHQFLASYQVVPLTVLVLIWLYTDCGLLLKEGVGRPRLNLVYSRSVAALLICLLTGSSGVYYAFFACGFFLFAGATVSLARKKLRPLLAAAALSGVVAAAVLANVAPNLWYRHEQGRNPHVANRPSVEAEIFGLKVTQLLLPTPEHRVSALRKLTERYEELLPKTEGRTATLGVIGSLGFLLLIGRFLLGRRDEDEGPLGVLSRSTAFAVLLATVGSFGALLSLLVLPEIRCYNRISVYVAFFSLTALALRLDGAYRKYTAHGKRRYLVYGLLAVVLTVGMLDQTSRRMVPPHAAIKAQYEWDRQFVSQVEAVLPRGAMVFQLPYDAFPEGKGSLRMRDYDQVRGYLHSRALRWSYGAMRGRDCDLWQDWLSALPLERLAETLAVAGFGGVWVDGAGYADSGKSVADRLGRLLQVSPLVSPEKRCLFFNLGPYAQRLRQGYTDAQWQGRLRQALHPLLLDWCKGFYDPEGVGTKESWRWCKERGEMQIVNPGPDAREVDLSLSFRTLYPQPADLSVESDLFSARLTVNASSGDLERRLLIPPGRHAFRFACNAPPAPGDVRRLVFRVVHASLREVRSEE